RRPGARGGLPAHADDGDHGKLGMGQERRPGACRRPRGTMEAAMPKRIVKESEQDKRVQALANALLDTCDKQTSEGMTDIVEPLRALCMVVAYMLAGMTKERRDLAFGQFGLWLAAHTELYVLSGIHANVESVQGSKEYPQ